MKQLFIDGGWHEGADITVTTNPSDRAEIVGEYASAGIEQVDLAIGAARAASESWRYSGVQKRADAGRTHQNSL